MSIVYKHIRLDNNEIFYIGIGKSIKRAYNKNNNRSKFWKNIVDKTDYKVEIIKDDLSWKEACELEKKLIKKYGRKDLNTGTLVNLTNGGDGYCNGPLSKEHKLKIGKAHKGMKRSNKAKLNISNGKKGMNLTEKHKQELKKVWKDKYNKGYLHPQSKKVIDTETNKIFNSIKEASEYFNIKYRTLNAKLSGQNKNNTNLKLI
jgi:hypothetical protein